MPRRYGTGLMGRGAMSGRRFIMGSGYGCRRGLGRSFVGEAVVLTDKEILTEQKELLQKRLESVNRQLENFSEVNK